jgi:hypothetical protein
MMNRRVGKGALFAPCPPFEISTIVLGMVGTPSGAHSRDRWLCPPYGVAYALAIVGPNVTSISVPECPPSFASPPTCSGTE